MKIIPIPLEPYGCNCYILRDDSGVCAVIDPECMGAEICAYLAQENLHPALILLTHGHVDHVGGVSALHKATGAKIAMDTGDAFLINGDPDALPASFPSLPERDRFAVQIPLHDGDVLHIGKTPILVIKTPGHTPGGVCFLAENCLFSGDTLFQNSIGRTDFKGGDSEALMASLKRLLSMPNDTIILPGHGQTTAMADEKTTNPYLRGLR